MRDSFLEEGFVLDKSFGVGDGDDMYDDDGDDDMYDGDGDGDDDV